MGGESGERRFGAATPFGASALYARGRALPFKRSKRGKMVFSVKAGLGPIRFGEPS